MLADSSSPQTPAQRAASLSLLSTPHGGLDVDALCESAIAALPSEAAAFRKGRKNVLNKMLGWVMKESRGRADSTQVRERLVTLLKDGGDATGI
jgi:aspartyl-tRNA(Asn)/glutamyl-tRNA(Gln) amidotransferase subunit B